MMNAEADVDLTDAELSSLTLNSNHSSLNAGDLFSSEIYRSLTPPAIKSIHSSNHSSKAASIIGDMEETNELLLSEDKKSSLEKNVTLITAGSLEPVGLTAPVTPDNDKTSSSLFGEASGESDFLLNKKASTESSQQLFMKGPENADFLSQCNSPASLLPNRSSNNDVNMYRTENFASSSRNATAHQQSPSTSFAQLNIQPNTNTVSPSFTQMSSSTQHTNMSQLQYPYLNENKSAVLQQSAMVDTQLNLTSGNHAFSKNVLNSFNAAQNVPATLNTTNDLTNRAKFQSPYQATNIFNTNNPNSSVSNITNPNTPMNTSNLFIPSMYNDKNETSSHQQNQFFTPTKPASNQNITQQQFTPSQPLNSSYYSPQQPATNTGHLSSAHGQQLHYEQLPNVDMNMQPLNHGNYQIKDERGIWHWIKSTVNQDWSEGAENIKKQIKHAADSVLTTLDPGMQEYLKPVIYMGVASQSTAILLGIKQGFTNEHSVAVVKGQHLFPSASSGPLLPVGFESVTKSIYASLEDLSKVNFEFQTPYVVTTAQTFIVELLSGRWSAMACVGLKDVRRNLVLYSFSQPISLPIECVTHAYNRTLQNTQKDCTGYDITLDEAVKLHIPYTKEQDWCFMLSGITFQELISNTARSLSYDYKRNTANNYQQSTYQQQNAFQQQSTQQQQGAYQPTQQAVYEPVAPNQNTSSTTNNKHEEFSVVFNGF